MKKVINSNSPHDSSYSNLVTTSASNSSVTVYKMVTNESPVKGPGLELFSNLGLL